MKKLIFIGLALLSTAAFAAVPETTELSCSDARYLVKNNGIINMSTNGAPYVRYVNEYNGSDCSSGEIAFPAFVQTDDSDKCFVGYVCSDDNMGLESLTSDN